ncbi:MAG: hypothetical protein J6S85_22265 [Methanobrevibacter sp.]|nr:hypothetical protein [Methanobrevibacter sp.]
MAIDKTKNCSLQVTISKDIMEQLEIVVKTFREENVRISKSDIVESALKQYIKTLVYCGAQIINEKAQKEEEPLGEKKDA